MTKYDKLTFEIQKSEEQSITINEAERNAALSLAAMVELSAWLKIEDKNRRMRKSGLKAIKAAIRLEAVQKQEKKPTEGALEDLVNVNPDYRAAEELYDDAEATVAELDRQFDISRESHLYFRTISKAAMNG